METCNAAEMETMSSIPRDNIQEMLKQITVWVSQRRKVQGVLTFFLTDEKQTTKGMRNRFVTIQPSTRIQLPEMLNGTIQKGGIMPAVILLYIKSKRNKERKR